MQENKPEIKDRQVYAKPQLVEFGSIEKLTQGTAGTLADGTHMTRK